MCGYPASGKTTHAQAIARHLSARGARVHVVNDESLGLVRSTAYANPAAEKVARGLLKAAVEQLYLKTTLLSPTVAITSRASATSCTLPTPQNNTAFV